MTVHLAVKALPNDVLRCGDSDIQLGKSLSAPVQTMRITLRARDDAGKTVLDGTKPRLCDQLLEIGRTAPFLRVPVGNATKVDVFAEAFAKVGETYHRTASGALYGISPTKAGSGLRLYPTEDFACAPAKLVTARAFHTATLLPDGRVVLIGGLTGTTEKLTMTGVPAIGTSEIYDPRDQTVVPFTDVAPPLSRAFHSAMLLSGSGPCEAGKTAILLVGGIGPTDPMTPDAPILAQENGQAGSRLVPSSAPSAGMPFGTSLGAHAVANEVVCLDTVAMTATRMPATGASGAFRAVATGKHGLVAAGGIDYDNKKLNTVLPVGDLSAFSPDVGSGQSVTLPINRTGATLSLIGSDESQALLWGGGDYAAPVGELITNPFAMPTVTPLSVSRTVATQFHTATVLTGGGVLVTGGFEIANGGSNQQPPVIRDAVRVVIPLGGTVTASPVALGAGYTADPLCSGTSGYPAAGVSSRYLPAGWESAVQLQNGRVLVTGGSPSSISADVMSANGTTIKRCQDCPTGSSVLCAIPQASLYDSATANITPAAPPVVSGIPLPKTAGLGVPRFGHTSTVLQGGSVFIAGGIGGGPINGMQAALFLDDLEVYNPSAMDAPPGEVDPDDPVAADLIAASLKRAPGGQATLADPASPFASCQSFQ